MEFASVIASCKHFIKENLKYSPLADLIGIDLDKELAKCASSNNLKRKAASSSSSSSNSAPDRRAQSSAGNHSGDADEHPGHQGGRTFTGALCWPYITEEIGFDVDLTVDKSLTSYQVKKSTLSKAVSRLASRRTYHPVGFFPQQPGGKKSADHEAYRQQCYFVTHMIYAFSDWGQHPLRRQLFVEEFEFIVSNTATVIEVLKVTVHMNFTIIQSNYTFTRRLVVGTLLYLFFRMRSWWGSSCIVFAFSRYIFCNNSARTKCPIPYKTNPFIFYFLSTLYY
jgi:hypothetical protein